MPAPRTPRSTPQRFDRPRIDLVHAPHAAASGADPAAIEERLGAASPSHDLDYADLMALYQEHARRRL